MFSDSILATFVVGAVYNYFVFKSTQFLLIIKGFVDLLSTSQKTLPIVLCRTWFSLELETLTDYPLGNARYLKGRDVMLFSDLGTCEEWSDKAQMLNLFFYSKSQFPFSYRESPNGIEVRGVRAWGRPRNSKPFQPKTSINDPRESGFITIDWQIKTWRNLSRISLFAKEKDMWK